MEKKFLVKLSSGTIKGPYLENEIDDMIYDNSLSGDEKIREYPNGEWQSIAKAPHFYDVFMGAFEANKGAKKEERETFIDASTATNIKPDKKEDVPLDKTVVQDGKKKENGDQPDGTQLYNQEDIKNVSDSLIKQKKDSVVDPDQKSPIIPQAVIISPQDDRPEEIKKWKIALILSIIAAGVTLFYYMFNSDEVMVIDVNGVKLEKVMVEVMLPIAESSTLAPAQSINLKNQALNLLPNDDIKSYKKAVDLLHASYEADTSNYGAISYIAYCYSRLYGVSKMDNEYLNSLKAIVSRAEKTDINVQSTTLAKMSYAIIQKDYNGAITSFNEMLNVLKDTSKIDPQLFIAASEAAIGQNDFNSAFQILNKVNKNNDTYPRAYYLEGIIRINNKEYELAASMFRKALDINPNHVASKVKLFELGKDASATNIFNYAKENYMNASHEDISAMLYLLGNIMVQNTDVPKAKYFYEKSLDFSASNVKAMIAYEQLGGNISKYKKEAKLSSLPNTETSTFLMRGDELYRLQKYRDASLQYRMAASLDPQNTIAWYKLGESYRMTYEYSKAIDAYKESLKLDKLSLMPMVKMARVQIDLYKFQEAADNLKKAQEVDPDNPDVLFTIGYLNDKRNLEEDAVKYYHRAVSKDFAHIDSLMALAKINIRYERYAEAQLLFEKVLNSQPDNFDAYVNITKILAK
ncbi:MAG: tetratricopeptide repeat protein, partial [Pseudomonadota bacterium]